MEDRVFVTVIFTAKETGGEIVGAINNARSGVIAPLELINIYAGVLR